MKPALTFVIEEDWPAVELFPETKFISDETHGSGFLTDMEQGRNFVDTSSSINGGKSN